MTHPVIGQLTDPAELLFRQVHPNSYDNGTIQKTAFWPGKDDRWLLSTRREAMTAQGAYEHWTMTLQRKSIGSYAVTVGEVIGIEMDGATERLAVVDDAKTEGEHHASIDYRDGVLTRGQREQAARKLVTAATSRGCQFRPA